MNKWCMNATAQSYTNIHCLQFRSFVPTYIYTNIHEACDTQDAYGLSAVQTERRVPLTYRS